MTSMNDLLARWTALACTASERAQTLQTLASAEHPLAMYLSANGQGQPELLIRSPHKPRIIDIGDAVVSTRTLAKSTDEWVLSLQLVDNVLRHPFMKLGVDLVERAGAMADVPSALSAIALGLSEWKRLLRPERRLSADAIRGLIGELWFALNALHPQYSGDQIVQGWSRSDTTPQDFLMSDGSRYEVKTIRAGVRKIGINSAEQLDPAEGPIDLAVLHVKELAATEEGGLDLYEATERLRALLSPEGQSLLDTTLANRGVDRIEDHSSIRVLPSTLDMYEVDANFPSLRATHCPAAVADVKYSLELSKIEPMLSSRIKVGSE